LKTLDDILKHVAPFRIIGPADRPVQGIYSDSRAVKPQGLFVAIKGIHADGHRFIQSAVEKGVTAIVCEEIPEVISAELTYIQVKNSAIALGRIAANFYDHPSRQVKIIGITGTNGKTTTATLLFKLFRNLGYPCGLLSTIHNQINDEVFEATHTTPDVLHLNELLKTMTDRGCGYCFMEVSSHAIAQNRIAGIEYAGGLFTNITHEHLDYHKTFDDYLKTKRKFFDELPSGAFALANIDDKNGRYMLQNTKASRHTYGLKTAADFKGKIIESHLEGQLLWVDGQELWFRLAGQFNAYNILAVYGAAVLLGEDKQEVLKGLSVMTPVEGRFDFFTNRDNITAIVDYAHTPDALLNVLSTIAGIHRGKGKIITVVGAGGDRDKSKRPLMGRIACDHSDRVIFTSDNPRTEDPGQIIKDMTGDLEAKRLQKAIILPDRREAIRTACLMAGPGDIILVAGKGHEKYQEINGVKHPFDDKKIVMSILGPAIENR
jgi:UDP-N-acetylmuramoyl-L-alanyl-D-glutamate--2,6-diaminopimelate ligase